MFKSEGFDLKLKIKSAEDLIQAITNEGFDTVDILVQEDNKYKARTIVLLGRDGLSLRTFTLTTVMNPPYTNSVLFGLHPQSLGYQRNHNG